MKNKTAKLKNIEAQRYSILTDDLEKCYICGQYKNDIHEIYGGANRVNSMKHGFCVPLCRMCHTCVTNNEKMSIKLKMICQKQFEIEHSHEEFMKIIGRNYL